MKTSGYPRPSIKNFDIKKKRKKNNTGIGPVKWNCLVHTNKIVPKKKRKEGGKKKDGYENSSNRDAQAGLALRLSGRFLGGPSDPNIQRSAL
jgi:hypothetical protein